MSLRLRLLPHRMLACAVLGFTCASGPAHAARPTLPTLQIPLESTGYLPVSSAHMAAGHTMLTLNYVDEQHLLLTYHTHALLARLPDATPDDEDRYVTAVLLELPTGKVIAQSKWRTRDHDRYLWALGQGRFLLRIRTQLLVLDPMANLAAGEAFRELPFVDVKRRIGLIDVAPDGELITVETVPPRKPALTGAAASAVALAATQPGYRPPHETSAGPEYVLHFFRLLDAEGHPRTTAAPAAAEGAARLVVASAGSVRAHSLIRIALTSAGYLTTARESSGVYLFDFHTHTGKKTELSPYETTCMPHAFFTSPEDFIAFGCRGGEDKLELSGFNMRGEEPWISVLSGQQLSASVVPAPAAGRFAFERTLSGSSGDATLPSSDASMNAQEITVYQHYDGRVLLHTQSDPVQLSGQNYDLSPSGMSFATIQNGKIAVYQLPGLTDKDRKELARSRAAEPENTLAAVRLNASPVVEEKEATSPLEDRTGEDAAAQSAKAVAQSAPAAAHVIENGDAPPEAADEPRRPPTLYDPDHPKTPQP